jgi:hypothetical protein
MSVVRKVKCACGKEYIDFGNQISKCATCDGTPVAERIQTFLKPFTYMDSDIVLNKTLQQMFAITPIVETVYDRGEIVPAAVATEVEMYTKHTPFWKKWFRRS